MTEQHANTEGRRPLSIALGVAVGLILLAVAWSAWDYVTHRGLVPRGTFVGGVDIGGLEPAAAEQRLATELDGAPLRTIMVSAGTREARLVPADVGLAVDYAATVDAAGVESINPIPRFMSLFGDRELPPVSHVDDATFGAEVKRIAGELSAAPVDATVSIDKGKVVTTEPADGQRVDEAAVADAIRLRWLDPQGVSVEPQLSPPAITAEDATAAADGPAAKAISGPLVVHGTDGVDGEIPVDRIGEVISFAPRDGALAPTADAERAEQILDEKLKETEVPATNAVLSSDGSVTPHVDGTAVDWAVTLTDLLDRAVGTSPRDWDAVYTEAPAAFTTEMAKNATFDEVIGEFTTSGYSYNSGLNIAVLANQLNGVVIGPGEVFSVNEFTGPRGLAQGYVESGIIANGRAGVGVGGGISQLATTLYNATYFAGLEDITHTPHSYYISRYPAGREATIFDGVIDLAFKNTNSHPIKIATSMGDGTVTVQILGVKEVTVESLSGGQWAPTAPWSQEISGPNCVPSSGAPGFTTSDTRVIYDLTGKEITRETQTTVYQPQPIVTCSS
ncbi:VanW family protein [Corynebacterium uterequi]|uniref:Putative vancomycin resistance protein n=1 Tax=Corynebacterium uterequi TaxID=1072256 RepID=A0A0G3HF96_9CORY|nr:VanW family protein [Corynebacterium uterequi]AKK12026.1 putative vancomycin resistance protein [Corynebacterium uterequi]